jgi:hypothetical protein
VNPDAAAHLRKARGNFAVFADLKQSGRNDWAVTVLFYTALQLVDARFVENLGTKPRDHIERNTWVFRHLRPIKNRCGELYSASKDARYDLADFSTPEVTAMETGAVWAIRTPF